MKITYRECDACGERTHWIDALPTDWGELRIVGGEMPELCPKCTQSIRDAVAKRKKS